ncbi:LolA family protein [Metabacillus iocasae]|uniref:Outer membrane lipoprotein-sorting protein n=1 Tax=Priestia iocasae TaxID=2291674 RepID=A0ABS2R007_9BACI|nr:outer membrane lipoprotein carrier protein LolA [Metabacillus iocasae]MBM7705020.1 outer membrane lipoprotein-sorting protein [Metabacillus iocasae]
MQKRLVGFLVCLVFVFMLAACGEKSQQDVMNSLDEKVEEMTGYKANAKMTLNTGKDSQVYDVEIWHSKPMYYRVNLKNATKEQSQMILRNDEGVFVLTPALNKSFRFQSDWPQNSSQAYLYESLVRDIMEDQEAEFTSNEKSYVFKTKTNYQNSAMLPKQSITLNKKDLTPQNVKIMDTDENVLIEVEFSDVQMNAKFDEGAFDTKRNMTGAKMEVPTVAPSNAQPFEIMYPEEIPDGSVIAEEKKIKTENGERIVIMYEGEKPFTVVQEKSRVAQASTSTSVSGELVDLGFTIGALTDKTLSWSFDGVDFMVSSNDLTESEFMMVARSIQSQMIK